jgi:hypothetical protein
MIDPNDVEEVEALRHDLRACASMNVQPSTTAADQAADVLDAYLDQLAEGEP